MNSAVCTDIGRVRTVNEDRAFVTAVLNDGVLAIVADGMGGHQAGDVASQMAIDLICDNLLQQPGDLSPEAYNMAIHEAIIHANQQIYEFASSQKQYNGMGTTVVVALATREAVLVSHIGDSRAYLVRDGKMTLLTEDHTLVNELIKSGQLTQEEAAAHPRRNVLTRALGTELTVEIDTEQFNWQPGDILLICTDGLSGTIPREKMFSLITSNLSLVEKTQQLIQSALEAGGNDNITVVLVVNETSNPQEAR